MSSVRYDKIGTGYNATRRADPHLTERMHQLLQPKAEGLYLDIGCGTGNYLTALSRKGLSFIGIDPSETMLAEARRKPNSATFICGKAEEIPLPDAHFDGAIAIVTLHHWDDMEAGLKEVARVLKPGARLVCFSFTPEQSQSYWLNHYFPRTMENTFHITPPLDEMMAILHNAGFSKVSTEKYFVHDGLEDHFLMSGKYKPEMYLSPEMRRNTSLFSYYADQAEVDAGLARLEADIESGQVTQVIQDHENELGDYIFIVAER
jgi:ubiquinone/menaquinone biosynthesis C-methylase UbiE